MTGRASERAQAAIEAVVVLPLCLVCAWVLVECGVVVRDQLAVSQAAGRGAVAALSSGDVESAARGALPQRLRRTARVELVDGRVQVAVRPRARLLGAALGSKALRADAVIAIEGGNA